MRKYAIAAAAVTMFGAAPAFADEAGTIEYGRVLVLENCSTCHATGVTGESTHPDAPPFRTLSQRYPLENLEEALAEGITTGHPDMPEFVATPPQIAGILAYIESISE
ncbi:MAG: cytochrome c [Rhizobiaceae bacterium]|nr:cytochrome c [Rhizobiaceae bacterium]MCC0044305.1 cytochrome c [Brucellaceae bacterium]